MCNSHILGAQGDLRLFSSTLPFIGKELTARKNLALWLQLTRSQARPGLHSKNVLVHFKGSPESAQTLGLAGPTSSPAFSGIQVISYPRAISSTNSGLLPPCSPAHRGWCFCKSLSEEWGQTLLELHKPLLISHWPRLSHICLLSQSWARGQHTLRPIRTMPEAGRQVRF